MRTRFADSGCWIALLYPNDQLHQLADAVAAVLTDCASFLVMEKRGIAEALAYDRDFEQAGFVALLRDASL